MHWFGCLAVYDIVLLCYDWISSFPIVFSLQHVSRHMSVINMSLRHVKCCRLPDNVSTPLIRLLCCGSYNIFSHACSCYIELALPDYTTTDTFNQLQLLTRCTTSPWDFLTCILLTWQGPQCFHIFYNLLIIKVRACQQCCHVNSNCFMCKFNRDIEFITDKSLCKKWILIYIHIHIIWRHIIYSTYDASFKWYLPWSLNIPWWNARSYIIDEFVKFQW